MILLFGFFSLFILAEEGVFLKNGMQVILQSGFFSLFIFAEQGLFPKKILNSHLKDHVSIAYIPVS